MTNPPRRDTVEEGYRPSVDEPYMNDRQLDYFRAQLLTMRAELSSEMGIDLSTDNEVGDEADLANRTTESAQAARIQNHHLLLKRDIDAALRRIDDGSYGYCEDTGEEIGLSRLLARPMATLSVEAQERRERAARQYGQ
ncbi:MAG: TraR/DksA C4-type zinc finger protein [Gammaproteobacteria bacterium]|nr:TraR/DksA C4-type zinc finger protein [Gammaproteobacteria bacterium]MCP5135248.1 TraR/DksA C4-type zinc finger protein [Gammaproteobacteria bacterium]